MSFIIFIIILSVLVFVHEMGHFLVAKKAGVRVEEFGFGFPPKALNLFKFKGTQLTLNWIPFGGFVKIFGENYIEEKDSESRISTQSQNQKSFTDVSKFWQVAILFAGVFFNYLLAWLLISSSFIIGMPYSSSNPLGNELKATELTVVSVIPGSPASDVELKSGDVIERVYRANSELNNTNIEEVSNYIGQSGETVYLDIRRGSERQTVNLTPTEKVIDGRFAVGISMDNVGLLKLPIHRALLEGLKTSGTLVVETVKGISNLILNSFKGNADLSQVAGPIGIIGIVGDASRLGFVYILTFAAFISINLAVINLLPFPSLDGGRILFVIIETIKGSPVNPKIFNIANTIGFLLLIGAMILITAKDISNLF